MTTSHADSVWAHRWPSHRYWFAPRNVWLISGKKLEIRRET